MVNCNLIQLSIINKETYGAYLLEDWFGEQSESSVDKFKRFRLTPRSKASAGISALALSPSQFLAFIPLWFVGDSDTDDDIRFISRFDARRGERPARLDACEGVVGERCILTFQKRGRN
jgi:hypothetical protein